MTMTSTATNPPPPPPPPACSATKRDARALLRAEAKFIAVDAQLPEQLAERSALGAGRHVVGHGVQPHVIFASRDGVKTVESANCVVAFEDAHAPAKMRQPDAGREARHAGPDDDGVVMRGS